VKEQTASQLQDLQQRLGVQFKDLRTLEQALVHRSLLRDLGVHSGQSNERLEFLGDAILGAIVARQLYDRLPNASEGDLTLLRTWLVRATTLGEWARTLELERYLRLGKSDEGGSRRTRLLARTFEAVVGAIYVDQGFRGVRKFLRPFIERELRARPQDRPELDAKSRLQQVTQSRFGLVPVYDLQAVVGPGHDPLFTVEVQVGGHSRATAEGRTKQAAEQAAARLVLDALEAQSSGAPDPNGSPLDAPA
jgi:ribonuclease-3